MTNNDKELLVRDLGIFELRGLARQLGVNSPTTKKREELIDCILKAMEGEEVSENTGKRKGRPFKQLSSIKDILNSVIEEPNPCEELSYSSIMNFAQVTAEFSVIDEAKGAIEQLEGYARVNNGKISFIDCNKNAWVFIDEGVQCSQLVNNGDKIIVNGYLTSSKNQYRGVEIIDINNQQSKDYKRHSIEGRFEVISNNVLPFGDKSIREGRRNSLCLQEDLYENDRLKNAYSYCLANNIDFVLLGANTSFEDSILFNNFDKKIDFSTKYGSADTLNFNKIIDAINYTTQSVDGGKNVLLIVTDIMEIVRVIERVLSQQYEDKDEVKKILIKELMSLAKTYKDGPSCTTLICYRKNDYDNDYLQNEILRICKEI